MAFLFLLHLPAGIQAGLRAGRRKQRHKSHTRPHAGDALHRVRGMLPKRMGANHSDFFWGPGVAWGGGDGKWTSALSIMDARLQWYHLVYKALVYYL